MDWKALVKSIAPTLGAALGGPMGGAATKFLADKFLGDPNATEQDLADVILSASPEKLAEIRKLDNDFKIEMRKLDIDVFKLEVSDKDSARDLAKVNMWPQIILSALFIGGFFSLTYIEASNPAISLSDYQKGILTAAIPMILQFWFGSSMGSKEKTAKMR